MCVLLLLILVLRESLLRRDRFWLRSNSLLIRTANGVEYGRDNVIDLGIYLSLLTVDGGRARALRLSDDGAGPGIL